MAFVARFSICVDARCFSRCTNRQSQKFTCFSFAKISSFFASYANFYKKNKSPNRAIWLHVFENFSSPKSIKSAILPFWYKKLFSLIALFDFKKSHVKKAQAKFYVSNLNKQEQKAKNKLFKANMAQRNLDICVLNYKLAKITKTILKIYNTKIKAFLEILIKNWS